MRRQPEKLDDVAVISAVGTRIGWLDLPGRVRHGLEDILGDRVVQAVSQPGGFSPGTADRVRTVTGRRAFVKAASPSLNEATPRLHRQEAVVSAALPAGTPAPELLGVYDDGYWIALVFQDIDGRHPVTPWLADEVSRVLAALAELADRLTPAPELAVPTAAASLAEDLAGWQRVLAQPAADLDPWARAHLDDLCRWAERGQAALVGDTLAHTDVRADNLLFDTDGCVRFVDWPWACVGPAWLDAVLLLLNVTLFGGHDVDALLARQAPSTDPADLTAVIGGLAGFFTDISRRPAPPGLPTVRAFQRAQAAAALGWFQQRLAGESQP